MHLSERLMPREYSSGEPAASKQSREKLLLIMLCMIVVRGSWGAMKCRNTGSQLAAAGRRADGREGSVAAGAAQAASIATRADLPRLGGGDDGLMGAGCVGRRGQSWPAGSVMDRRVSERGSAG